MSPPSLFHQTVVALLVGALSGIIAYFATLTLPLTQHMRTILSIGLFFSITLTIFFYIFKKFKQAIQLLRPGYMNLNSGEVFKHMSSQELYHLSKVVDHFQHIMTKQLKQALSQKEYLNALLTSMSEGVIAVDRNEIIKHINETGRSMLNLNQETGIGFSIQETIRIPKLQKLILNSLQENKALVEEIDIYHNNQTKHLLVHTTPIKGNQRPSGTVAVLNDVTPLKNLETLRKEFIGNVSHELKTPLTVIKGFSEILQQTSLDLPPKTQEHIQTIHTQAERLGTMIEDLLKLAQLEHETIPTTEMSLKTVIESAVALCAPQAKSKNISIVINCPQSIRLNLNHSLLSQSLFNLIQNGIKYSPPKSHIWIKAVEKDQQIILTIKDEGIGIDRTHHGRIFERFYRVDPARTRESGGTGLGLSIAKHIIQAHKGAISVKSELGHGTTFCVSLTRN